MWNLLHIFMVYYYYQPAHSFPNTSQGV